MRNAKSGVISDTNIFFCVILLHGTTWTICRAKQGAAPDEDNYSFNTLSWHHYCRRLGELPSNRLLIFTRVARILHLRTANTCIWLFLLGSLNILAKGTLSAPMYVHTHLCQSLRPHIHWRLTAPRRECPFATRKRCKEIKSKMSSFHFLSLPAIHPSFPWDPSFSISCEDFDAECRGEVFLFLCCSTSLPCIKQ